MDQKKMDTPDKLKASNIIIFSPQELADLGILPTTKETSSLDSKPNKKQIIQVIKRSINSSTVQPSTSAVINTQEMKATLMKKATSYTEPSTSNKNVDPQMRVLNAEISKSMLMKSGRMYSSPKFKKAVPTVVKKLLKPAPSTFSGSEMTGKSILTQNERIKNIILSAVRSKSGQTVNPEPTIINNSLQFQPENSENENDDDEEVIILDPESKQSDNDQEIKGNTKIINIDADSRKKEDVSPKSDTPLKTNLNDSAKKKVVFKNIKVKGIKVVSNKQVSLTKEQLKNLFMPKLGKDVETLLNEKSKTDASKNIWNSGTKSTSTASTSEEEFKCEDKVSCVDDLTDDEMEDEEKLHTHDNVDNSIVSSSSKEVSDVQDNDVIVIEDNSSDKQVDSTSSIENQLNSQDSDQEIILIHDDRVTKNVKRKIETQVDENGTISVVVVVDEKEYDSLKKINVGKAEKKKSVPSTVKSDDKQSKKDSKTPNKRKSDHALKVNKVNNPVTTTRLIPSLSSELRTYSAVKTLPKPQKIETIEVSDEVQPSDDSKDTSSLPADSQNTLIKVPKKRGRPRKNPLESPKAKQVIPGDKKSEHVQKSDATSNVNCKNEGSLIPKNVTMEIDCKAENLTSSRDNVLSPPVETPEKVPKKRGRPRKNPLDPSKPKKPKIDRNSSLDSSIDNSSLDVFTETDISKSGRKRRKINYYDMENNFLDDFYETKRTSFSSDDDKKPLKIRKSSAPSEASNKPLNDSSTQLNSNNEDVSISESKATATVLESKQDTNLGVQQTNAAVKQATSVIKQETAAEVTPETNDEEKESTGDKPATTEGVNPATTEDVAPFITQDATAKNLKHATTEDVKPSTTNNVNAATSDDMKMEPTGDEEHEATDSSRETPTPKKTKTKRYQWTGQTQKMMQSIFSAAMKASTPPADPNQDPNTRDNQQIPSVDDANEFPTTPKVRGRPKKGPTGSKVVIDDDGKVKCNTCNTKVVNREWQSHNRNVHYNMAWREGEPFLSVDDHGYLRRTLTPILQEDKLLICNKCDTKWHAVNDFIVHMEDCLGIVKNELVTCAICNEEIDKLKWMSHKKKKHNNLTWRVGDPPLDLNNQDLVVTTLNALYKAKVPLYCYKCRDTKKSVVGFLSHQSQCGNDVESAKIECPLCGRRVLPVSMASHHKLVHEQKSGKIDKTMSAKEDGSPSSKRQAAKKAMKMIDTISKAKVLTEFSKYYIESPTFKDEDFILPLLNEELQNSGVMKCKFENCVHQTENWEEMVEHLDDCPYKTEQHFVCKKCLSIYLLEEEVRKHVEDDHKVSLPKIKDYELENESTDGESEEKSKQELLKLRKYENQRLAKNANVKIKPRFLQRLPTRSHRGLFSSAFEYTLEFCNEHFTESVLFDRLRYLKTDWKLLDIENLDDYWPKEEFSCNVSMNQEPSYKNVLKYEQNFCKFELFEAVEDEDGATIFCGGPILAMAWLPTPHILLHCSQVLAVAVAKDFESNYAVNMNYNEPCIVQFWDFGVLKKKIRPTKPKLIFGLALNYGPIWHMEWCPSGCYDEKVFDNGRVKRMGLLAVAGSVPTVNIYSIPFVNESDDLSLIYKAKPLIKLQLFRDQSKVKNKNFPTRISWSKASGHRYVAVGYTDGMVALFDLEATSDLLKFTDESGIEIISPYKFLKAHNSYISVLSLIHLSGGTRYLLTGSFDRNTCVWDLTDDTYSLCQRKKIATDGTWLTNWIAYVTAGDESGCTAGVINSSLASHRNYMYEVATMMSAPSTLTSVSASDWLNGLIQCTTSGEILVIFPGQMQYSVDNDKRIKYLRWMLGFTKLADMSKTPIERVAEEAAEKEALKVHPKTKGLDPDTAEYIFKQASRRKEYQPLSYEMAANKYGLVICDINRKTPDETPKSNLLNVLEPSRPDLYPLQAINKVAFNPNCQASLYFVTGYQVGFVRLRYMRFLENDKQVV